MKSKILAMMFISALALCMVKIVLIDLASANFLPYKVPLHNIEITESGEIIGTNKITCNVNVYTFKENIIGCIVVNRNNVIIDGAEYSIQGNSNYDTGIFIQGRHSVTIRNLTISNYARGVVYSYLNDWGSDCRDHVLTGNTIVNNYVGVSCYVCGSITISENIIMNNECGVTFFVCDNSRAFCNYFVNNTKQVNLSDSTVNLDYGSLGNYWSNYNGTDTDGDGIGDTPYVIDANNIDNCPLMTPLNLKPTPILIVSCKSSSSYSGFKVEIKGTLTYNETAIPDAPILLSYSGNGGNSSWENISLKITDSYGSYSSTWMHSDTGNCLIKATYEGGEVYLQTTATVSLAVAQFDEKNVFSVASNSTLANLAFNSTSRILSFNVSGSPDTVGYSDVHIAKTLVKNASSIEVSLDGNVLDYAVTSTDDAWLLHFTYNHSSHVVTVGLGSSGWFDGDLARWMVYGAVATLSIVSISLLLYFKKRRTP